MTLTTNTKLIIGASVAGLALILWLKKKGVADAVAGGVGIVSDAAGGVVMGVGDLFGLPRTSSSDCARLKAEGKLWEASFVCPAGEYVSTVVGTVNDAAGNAIQSVGTKIGIPRTNETECEKALREGRTWDASFACPAGTFLKDLFGFTSPTMQYH